MPLMTLQGECRFAPAPIAGEPDWRVIVPLLTVFVAEQASPVGGWASRWTQEPNHIWPGLQLSTPVLAGDGGLGDPA